MALHKTDPHWLYKNINTWSGQNLGCPTENDTLSNFT